MALADLDIAGEEARVTPIRKTRDLVEEGIKKGYKNIVACGDDSTAHEVINTLAGLKVSKEEICFGIIPIRPSKIAQVLGVPSHEEAIKTISKRRIERVDLGKIGDQYFLISCDIETDESLARPDSFWRKLSFMTRGLASAPKIELNFKEGYRVTAQPTKVCICNILDYGKGKLRIKTDGYMTTNVSPQDELLDVVIVGKLSRSSLLRHLSDIQCNNFGRIPNVSLFRTKKVNISSENPISVMIDRQKMKANNFNCEVVPRKLNVIVGKERKF